MSIFIGTIPVRSESDYPEHCANPDKEVIIGVQVDKILFNVTQITVNKGECFTVVFQNLDPSIEHDFVIDEVGGGNHSRIDANLNGPNIDQVDFDSAGPTVNYGYGANGINKFNIHAPNVDSEFTYYCDVPGHKANGMLGKLIVGNGKSVTTNPDVSSTITAGRSGQSSTSTIKTSPNFDLSILLVTMFSIKVINTRVRKR